MPIQTSPKRTLKGLYSNMNHSSGIPEGGLLEANNCVVERPGLLSKRKGFQRYGEARTGPIRSLMDYQGRLVVYDGSKLSCDVDGDGELVQWEGNFDPPTERHAIRGANTKKNFYFTSSNGVYRNDSLTSVPQVAGMTEGLDIDIEKYGSGDGWFPHNSQVSYIVTWSMEDANESTILGSPSFRHTVQNKMSLVQLMHEGQGEILVEDEDHGFNTGDIVTISGSDVQDYEGSGKIITKIDDDNYRFDFSVDQGPAIAQSGKDYFNRLTFTVPDSIVSGDKYQIWRTFASETDDDDPGDDHMLVISKEITDEEVTAGIVVFSDTVLEISLGEFLYTNAFQETIDQGNDRPPLCKDMTEWRGHLFYADLTYRSEKEIHLSEIKDLIDGDKISLKFAGATLNYTFSGFENFENRKVELRTREETTEQNIEYTMRSFVRVVNRDSTNSLLHAHYISGPLDSSGKVLLRTRTPHIGGFSITVSRTEVGDSFKEPIPTSGESYSSKADTIPNGLAYSKVLEPDAVPKINVLHVGHANEPIQRIMALKTSLIILKADGAYRLTGNTPSTFVLQDLDPSVSFKCPNAATTLNDSIYCLATQGILKIGENGTTAISYPIEDQIRNIASFEGNDKYAFAVSNEQNRVAIIFTQKNSGDRSAKIGWVYNYMTKEWTTWTKDVSCGTSLLGDRNFYLGHSLDNYVLKQRGGVSERNSRDYIDEEIPITVSGVVGTQVTFIHDYDMAVRPGYLFIQRGEGVAGNYGLFSSKISSITSTTPALGAPTTVVAVLERVPGADSDIDINIGSATVGLPIDSTVKWAPDNLGVSEVPKQFTYAMLTMETGTTLTNELGFYSDAVRASEWVGDIKLNVPEGWGGGEWGTMPWGNEESLSVVPLVSAVPRQHQRCRELTVMFRHRSANEEFNIESIALRYKSYKGKLVRAPE